MTNNELADRNRNLEDHNCNLIAERDNLKRELAAEKQKNAELAERERKLRKLVRHCCIHSGYPECGYPQMTTEQKKLYCEINGAKFESLWPRYSYSEALATEGK